MPAESEAVRGIRAKLRRAFEHLETLDAEIGAFHDRGAYTLHPNDDSESAEWSWVIVLKEPLPLMWSVILGEMVHDLRSALDHAVYQLACQRNFGGHVEHTMFPVFIDPDEFDQHGARRIRRLSHEAADFIKSLQPFARDTITSRNLNTLHKLCNQDKHRIIQPWGFQFNGLGDISLISDPPANVEQIVICPDVISDGAVAVTVRFSRPVRSVKVEGSLSFNVAFDDPAHPVGYDSTMWSFYDTTAAVVHMLLSMLGTSTTIAPI